MLTERAYAKINYYLDVTNKRPDGYHDLVSVMQTVSLFDTLTLTPREDGQVVLLSDMPGPAEKNLAVRAARAYFAGGETHGYTITLEKHIPAAAGLGVGSADAAAVLRALDRAEGRHTPASLRAIAAALGADVPFCLVGGTCLCRGVGEILTPLENRAEPVLVIAAGGEGVSTPAAFDALDARENKTTEKNDPFPLISALEQGDTAGLAAHLFNSFEPVILGERPVAGALKKTLLDAGAAAALMSGSGPAVFGVFEDVKTADTAVKRIAARGLFAAVAGPVKPC